MNRALGIAAVVLLAVIAYKLVTAPAPLKPDICYEPTPEGQRYSTYYPVCYQ